MYFCFKLKEIDGVLAPYPFDAIDSDLPVVGMVCLDEDDTRWDAYKVKTDTGDWGWNLWDGYLNLPHYRFDQAAWDAGKDPFSPYDFGDSQQIKLWFRRRELKHDIGSMVTAETELKRIRKAILAIVAEFPALEQHPDIAAFTGLSESIEGKIAEKPKTELSKMDLRAANAEPETHIAYTREEKTDESFVSTT